MRICGENSVIGNRGSGWGGWAVWWLLGVGVWVGSSTVEGGTLVSNGGFESPGFDFAGGGGPYRYLSDAGDPSIAGWTTTRSQSVGERVYWYHSTLYGTFAGDYGLALTDAGRAQTQVQVMAGRWYELRLHAVYDLNNPQGAFALRLTRGDDSTTLLPADASDTGVPEGNQTWRQYRALLRPSTSGLVALSIENVAEGFGTTDGGIAIDEVSLTAVVPEPAGLVLVGTGVLALVGVWGGRMRGANCGRW